jgi:hypothetical protein
VSNNGVRVGIQHVHWSTQISGKIGHLLAGISQWCLQDFAHESGALLSPRGEASMVVIIKARTACITRQTRVDTVQAAIIICLHTESALDVNQRVSMVAADCMRVAIAFVHDESAESNLQVRILSFLSRL